MKGSVRKRGTSWSYYVDIGEEDGKRKRQEKGGFRTKKEAQEALNEKLVKLQNGYIEPKNITVQDYYNDWLTFIQENKKTNTYHRYRDLYNQHIKNSIGKFLLKDIRPIHIDNIITSAKRKKYSGSTLQNIYTVLNAALNKAMKLQIINDNPCRFIDRPKREKFRANTLELDEIATLFQYLGDDTAEYSDYIMYIGLNIILELGIRRGELGGLDWSNIDFKNNCINITNNLVYTNNSVEMSTTKTEDSERILYISESLKSLLESHRKVQLANRLRYGEFYTITNDFEDRKFDLVMTWENGKYVHPNYFTLKFRKIADKLGFKKHIRFHDLRHTNATLLLQQGINFKVIQKRLGHAQLSTTMDIYSHVNLEMQKEATDKISSLLYGGKPVANRQKN